jgi:hypothetical protein
MYQNVTKCKSVDNGLHGVPHRINELVKVLRFQDLVVLLVRDPQVQVEAPKEHVSSGIHLLLVHSEFQAHDLDLDFLGVLIPEKKFVLRVRVLIREQKVWVYR